VGFTRYQNPAVVRKLDRGEEEEQLSRGEY